MNSAGEITYEDALNLEKPVFIDVRAPSEFAQDHIPGALNLPLFDDEERAMIGKLYRAVGANQAVLKGTEIAGKRISLFIQRIREFGGRSIVFYCFRGGMRSSALVALLGALGINVYRLIGGYKEYRRYISERITSLQVESPVFILNGLAGVGKTLILRNIPCNIDLEGCAGHRSSVFGALRLTPRTQKHFESVLVRCMDGLHGAPYIVIEGESRRIGNVHIPGPITRLIQSCPAIVVTAPMERRVEMLLEDYGSTPDINEALRLLDSIGQGLGKKNRVVLKDLLVQGNMEEFVTLLLKKYYDPLYAFSLNKANVIATVHYTDPVSSAQEVLRIIEAYLKEKKEILQL